MGAAEAVCTSAAERACLGHLRSRSRQVDGAIERHSVRVFAVVEQLAERNSIDVDREVALCACLLHDVGLYEPGSGGRLYLARGRAAGQGVLAPFGWPAGRVRLCLDAVELHHRLTPQWDEGAEVELLRIADLVDGSAGIVRAGLDRAWLRALFDRVPRAGLYRELLRHSLSGAPCLTRALAGAAAYPFQR